MTTTTEPAAGHEKRIELRPVETRLLTLLAEGCTYATIARELGIKESAAGMTLSRLYQRIGARNGTHAVALAIRAGLLPQAGLAK